ncbi:uncharacterized protein LOC125177944 [Hyalella azteca]|uniref:Uncharacterized protein LOC125177944 n=1 Tax=Hyalella azteca TaxID=294128 RepID=A0A979FK87_HYAAZ|nr:uncharacterized protein LOC125177944 [Hyalella azteca]
MPLFALEFSGTTRDEVTQAFADTRSSDEDVLTAVSAVMLAADDDAHCVSWGTGSNTSGTMEVSSAAWNRSVCAVHHLEQRPPWVIILELCTLILLVLHAVVEHKFLRRTTNSMADVHGASRVLRIENGQKGGERDKVPPTSQ